MAPTSTRARALGLARRLAADALQRLAREVDRLSQALEPLRGVTALREPLRRVELEVSAREAPRGFVESEPSASEASEASETVVAEREPSHATLVDAAHEAAAGPATASEARAADPDASPAAPPPSPSPSITPALRQVGHLRDLVDPQLATLRATAAWEQAEDPVAAVHRTRVATRRLRAFVRLFAPLLGSKRARKLERRLRAITRSLGPVREHDVLLAGLAALHAGADPLAQAALEHVQAWAQAQRRKAVRRAHAALAELDVVALVDALDGEVDRVCGRLLRHGHEPEPLPVRAAALLEPELARAFAGMPRPAADTDVDALHDVRIRAKRLRYALELLQPTRPDEHRSLRPPLKRVQSSLGDHREAAQLLERTHERRAALTAHGQPTLAGALEPLEASLLRRRQRAFERAMRALAELDARVAERTPSDPTPRDPHGQP